jgi:serine protease Do
LITVDPQIEAARTPTFGAAPEPGTLAAAYVTTGATESVVPVFITSVNSDLYTVASTGPALKPGTPIYNLSGELLAISTETERSIAISARQAAERLLAALEAGDAQPASLGITFQPLTGAITSLFGQTGALVADVVPGGPAAVAGLRPGDLLLAVGADMTQSPEAAHRAIVRLALDQPSTIRVKRGSEMLVVTVTAASAYVVSALASGPIPDDEADSIVAGELFAEPALTAAGIRPDVRVISINGQQVSSLDSARRELGRNQTRALLHVRNRAGERFFTVVEPES